MKTNRAVKTKKPTGYTHAGSPSTTPSASVEHQLRRLVMANMLWEDQFYIDGVSTATLIKTLSEKVDIGYLGDLAVATRTNFKLRHVPLFLLASMVNRARKLPSQFDLTAYERAIIETIRRPDEMGELISIYNKEFVTGSKKLRVPSLMKRALAKVFLKFDTYQLSKYANRPAAISLRDVMFLVHPKPDTEDRKFVWTGLANKTLKSADTWEVALSSGEDKAATFERLIGEGKLGGLAFLRNMRNLIQSGVSREVINTYMDGPASVMRGVLPFQFFKAREYAGEYGTKLEAFMLRTLADKPKLQGKTLIIVDMSGSMSEKISGYSEMNRIDASASLASIARELADSSIVISTSAQHIQLPSYARGFSLVDQIKSSQIMSGTYLRACLSECKKTYGSDFDRVILVTDEQNSDGSIQDMLLGKYNYIINVGAYQNGIGFGKWTTLTGFSEAVFDFMIELERAPEQYRLAA